MHFLFSKSSLYPQFHSSGNGATPPTALQTGPLTQTFLCQPLDLCFSLLASLQGRFCPPNSQFIFSLARGISFKVCQILCPNESFLVPGSHWHIQEDSDLADRKLPFASSSNVLKALCSPGSVSLKPNSPQHCVFGFSLGVPHSQQLSGPPPPQLFCQPPVLPPALLACLPQQSDPLEAGTLSSLNI